MTVSPMDRRPAPALRRALLLLWFLGLFGLMLVTLELGLRWFMGFGNPVLYDNTYAYGYKPMPNQQVRRTARRRVTINNVGLRARRDWPALKPAGQVRVLYLGDSVTWGGSVLDDAQTFSEQSGDRLRRMLGTDVLVGNGGVNGWGPVNIRGVVEKLGIFGSDVVVVTALNEDVERPLAHIGEMPFWNRKPSSALEEVASAWIAYKLGLRRYVRKQEFVPPAEMDSVCRAHLNVYLEAGRLASLAGAKVLMVWHPSRAAASGGPDDPYRRLYLEGSRKAGFAALDMLPAVRSQPHPERLYLDTMHLNWRGHELYGPLLADAVAALLREGA
jgi:hypothetical protein